MKKDTAMRFRALLTDVDGTAVESETRNRKVIEDLSLAGGFEITPEQWGQLVGGGDEVIWNRITEIFPAFADTYPTGKAFEEACADEYGRRLDEIKLHEPVRNIVEMFLENQDDVMAVTNSIRRVAIENLEFHDYPVDQLHGVLGKDDIVAAGLKAKPSKDHYAYALQLVNEFRAAAGKDAIAASDCLVLEDSHTGVKSGLKNGMTVIQIIDDVPPMSADEVAELESAYGGSYYTATLDEIEALVERLNAQMPPQRRSRPGPRP